MGQSGQERHHSAWSMGDRVLHTGKPEWGVGQVVTTKSEVREGAQCQKLTIRFDRAGIKTVSTAYAKLEAADVGEAPAGQAATGGSWLDELEAGDPVEIMTRIAEPAGDPFRPLADRLRAPLGLYRFEPAGASLLDWAAAQSRLKDPLSRFSRHELEDLFRRWRRRLDEHLGQVAGELRRKEGPAAVARAAEGAPKPGRDALLRAHAGR